MKLSRSENTKRNMLYGFINKIIRLFLPFIVRTVMIQKLGVEYLGLNSLFSSILQVLNMAELGFGSALVYSMYQSIARDDSEEICALLRFYRSVYRIIGIIILLAGLLMLPFIPRMISGSYPENINLYVLFCIYLANTVLSYWLCAYKKALLNAYQRMDIIYNINSIVGLFLNLLQIVTLCIFKNYYLYLIIMPICTCLDNIISAYLVKRIFPQYICEGELSTGIKKSIKTKVTGLMINKLCQTSRNAFDSIFISSFLGLSMAAIYSNYYYVMMSVITIVGVVTSSMLAGVGNSIASETPEKNYSDLKKINFIYMWLSGWCTVCLLCLIQPFMKLWVGKDLMFSFPVVVLLVIYFYMLKVGDIRAMYSDAAGLWWENRYRAVIEAVTNVILNYVLVKKWGIYGIIFATLITLFVINYCFGSQIVFKHYFKNGKLGEYFGLNLIYATVTLIVCIVVVYICNFVMLEGIVGLVVKFLICCIVPNIIYLLVYYHTKQYRESMSWFLKVLHLDKKLSFLTLTSKSKCD